MLICFTSPILKKRDFFLWYYGGILKIPVITTYEESFWKGGWFGN